MFSVPRSTEWKQKKLRDTNRDRATKVGKQQLPRRDNMPTPHERLLGGGAAHAAAGARFDLGVVWIAPQKFTMSQKYKKSDKTEKIEILKIILEYL